MLIEHKKQWEFLKNKLESNQLSHAYLFSGANGIGKKSFAKEFIKLINCQTAQTDKKINITCQKCFSCLAIEKGNFPDFITLSEANKKDEIFGDGGEIKISQIRDVQSFLSYKSYYGSFKTVIVDDAEKMTQDAQNCFLKSLEEPKGKTLIILISSKPDLLLSTITSRCQTIKFFKPKNLPINSEKVERENKILADLLPVINSTLAEKFKYTKAIDFEKQRLGDILDVLQNYYREILLADYSQKKVINILNLIEEINNKYIFTNVNPKLALEILLMET